MKIKKVKNLCLQTPSIPPRPRPNQAIFAARLKPTTSTTSTQSTTSTMSKIKPNQA